MAIAEMEKHERYLAEKGWMDISISRCRLLALVNSWLERNREEGLDADELSDKSGEPENLTEQGMRLGERLILRELARRLSDGRAARGIMPTRRGYY